MLFKSHGLSLLADIPQLNHPLIVTADQVALHIAVPAHAAQFGPAQSHTMVTKYAPISDMVHSQSAACLVFSIIKGLNRQLLKVDSL